jgi:hypothetical protein
LTASLALARATGERLLEGHALALLGDILRAERSPTAARESYEASLAIRRAIGDVPGEGWMLYKLASLPDSERSEALRLDALRLGESCNDAALVAACNELKSD